MRFIEDFAYTILALDDKHASLIQKKRMAVSLRSDHTLFLDFELQTQVRQVYQHKIFLLFFLALFPAD